MSGVLKVHRTAGTSLPGTVSRRPGVGSRPTADGKAGVLVVDSSGFAGRGAGGRGAGGWDWRVRGPRVGGQRVRGMLNLPMSRARSSPKSRSRAAKVSNFAPGGTSPSASSASSSRSAADVSRSSSNAAVTVSA